MSLHPGPRSGPGGPSRLWKPSSPNTLLEGGTPSESIVEVEKVLFLSVSTCFPHAFFSVRGEKQLKFVQSSLKKSENGGRSFCCARLRPPAGGISSFHHQPNRTDVNIPGQREAQPSATAVSSPSGVRWDATIWEGWEQHRDGEESVAPSRPTNLQPAPSGGRTEKLQANQKTVSQHHV